MKNAIPFVFSLILFISCQRDPNKQVDEGNVDKNTYTSREIGWSIRIPEGWEVIEKDKIEATEEKGRAALEETAGGKIDADGLKHLISFRKDKFNVFLSTSQPVSEEYPGEYEARSKDLNELIYNTYVNQGISIDSLSGDMKIGDLDFKSFTIKIFAPDGKLMMTQIMCAKLINGYDFGTIVNYNNDKDRDIMLNALKKSTFSKK